MAFNSQVFRQRAGTAILFAAAMIGGVLGGKIPFLILFSFVGLACAWELFGLLLPPEALLKRIFYTFLALMPWWFVNSWWPPLDWLPVFVGLVFLVELFDLAEKPFDHVGHFCLALFYIGVPLSLLHEIALTRTGELEIGLIYQPLKVMGLLLLTWSNDTFAYLVGSFLGKTPLFERISPKKTWEGTIGGGLLTIGLAWLLFQLMGQWSMQQWLALGAVVAIFGTLGDLVESALKRSTGVKDSGSLLPGHGGLLDRFDAFIFMLPWVWLVLQLLKN